MSKARTWCGKGKKCPSYNTQTWDENVCIDCCINAIKHNPLWPNPQKRLEYLKKVIPYKNSFDEILK